MKVLCPVCVLMVLYSNSIKIGHYVGYRNRISKSLNKSFYAFLRYLVRINLRIKRFSVTQR
jgi:hypothetical protein